MKGTVERRLRELEKTVLRLSHIVEKHSGHFGVTLESTQGTEAHVLKLSERVDQLEARMGDHETDHRCSSR